MSKENEKRIMRISDLYPDLTIEEQIDAEENLRRYLAVVMGIFEHISEEKPEILTELQRRARLRKTKNAHS